MTDKKPAIVADVVKEVFDQTTARLKIKGKEYDSLNVGEDFMELRLKSIRDEARMNHCLPVQLIQVLMGKHVCALMDTKKSITKKEFEERAIDIIAYLVLWYGFWSDE